jgi:predicted transcriptional regulator
MVKYLNSEVKQQQLDWRRSRVLELSSEGYSQREIAQKLQVDPAAVNRDVQFLRQQAQENIQKHIHEVVPEEYQTGGDSIMSIY